MTGVGSNERQRLQRDESERVKGNASLAVKSRISCRTAVYMSGRLIAGIAAKETKTCMADVPLAAVIWTGDRPLQGPVRDGVPGHVSGLSCTRPLRARS